MAKIKACITLAKKDPCCQALENTLPIGSVAESVRRLVPARGRGFTSFLLRSLSLLPIGTGQVFVRHENVCRLLEFLGYQME
jgi:hypothetical protein